MQPNKRPLFPIVILNTVFILRLNYAKALKMNFLLKIFLMFSDESNPFLIVESDDKLNGVC